MATDASATNCTKALTAKRLTNSLVPLLGGVTPFVAPATATKAKGKTQSATRAQGYAPAR